MSLFEKLFGSKKKVGEGADAVGLVDTTLGELIRLSGLDLKYDLEEREGGVLFVEFHGTDEEILTDRDGQVLDSFQLLLQRVVQHQLPDDKTSVEVDCGGFRERATSELIEVAEKLKEVVLSKGKSVYFRALAPKERKVVHQYLAEDGRIRSRSVGEGHFKKIKIYPAKDEPANSDQEQRG